MRDHLSLRARALNDAKVNPHGEFILYWMQTTLRLEENWALRAAILESNRLGRPIVILQELSPGMGAQRVGDEVMRPTARHWSFLLDGAAECARTADSLGIGYLFLVHPSSAPFGIGAIANRASLVVTDDDPTGGMAARGARLAALASCSVVAVESNCVVPAALFLLPEYSRRTFRPKVTTLLDNALEPVASAAPKCAVRPQLMASLHAALRAAPLPIGSWDAAARRAALASCSVDQTVMPAPAFSGGRAAGVTRFEHFLARGLSGFSHRRNDPSDRTASSGMSPYLRWGHISSAEIVRAARSHGTPADVYAFIDNTVVWRELAFNCCLRSASPTTLECLPEWIHRSMERHAHDHRPHDPTPWQIDVGETGLPLWDAAHAELRETGALPQQMRKLWGKSLITMVPSYVEAHSTILRLNTKYALDGGDACGLAAALWCFGKFDRPFAPRPIWGGIRPMSLARAAARPATRRYLAGHAVGGAGAGEAAGAVDCRA